MFVYFCKYCVGQIGIFRVSFIGDFTVYSRTIDYGRTASSSGNDRFGVHFPVQSSLVPILITACSIWLAFL